MIPQCLRASCAQVTQRVCGRVGAKRWPSCLGTGLVTDPSPLLWDLHQTHSYQMAESCLPASTSREGGSGEPPGALPGCPWLVTPTTTYCSGHRTITPDGAGRRGGVGSAVTSGMLRVNPWNKALRERAGGCACNPSLPSVGCRRNEGCSPPSSVAIST